MSGINNVNKSRPVVAGVDLNSPAQTFNVVIALCGIIFILALSFFSCIRLKLRQIYSPRLLLIERKSVPGSTSQTIFSWIGPSFKATDQDIYAFSGLDALVFLRFMRLVLKFALITLPFGMIVLLPLNIYGGNQLTDGLDKLSMSNVQSGSSLLWFHWIAVWVYSFVVLYLTFLEWKVYTTFRQSYLKKGISKQFTVLVQNIPEKICSNDGLKTFVDKLFPKHVESVYMVKDLNVWSKLIEKHDSYVIKWEVAKLYLEKNNKRMTLKKYPCAKERDAISEYEFELQEIQNQLADEQFSSKHQTLPCAFVFFKSLKGQASSLKSVWDSSPFHYHVTPAPEPKEILWGNLAIPFWQKSLRNVVGYIFIFMLVIFWTTPILFISSLTKLSSIASELKWLDEWQAGTSTLVMNFIQGVIPVLLIAIFYIILPYILRAVGKFQGHISKSEIALITFKFLFVFQTFNTFFIYIVSGSVLQDFQKIINSPFELPSYLAKSLPSQAGFFLNYITLMSFVGLAIELTRIVPLIVFTINIKFFAHSQRQIQEAWKPKGAEYEIMYSQVLLFFLIGLSYSILSPIIIPFFVLYNLFGYIVWTHQLLYVYIPDNDHGGKFWPDVFSRIIACMVVFQLLMIGVFLLKQVWYAAAFTAPLVIITVVFWLLMVDKFQPCSEFLVLSEAVDTKVGERRFLEAVRRTYIRNYSIPDIFELSTDNKLPPDDWLPFNDVRTFSDEESHDLGENSTLLSK
ncbi:uncharacterized protein LOC100213564 isoform X3 [Hydra vulgaris]|uniref:Uncharacterized protein LOC100213564 isoform X3 n=1 Tax=Hydra vulgaris TaxID=6087 RepID=A0ABM4D8W5_HYDVU